MVEEVRTAWSVFPRLRIPFPFISMEENKQEDTQQRGNMGQQGSTGSQSDAGRNSGGSQSSGSGSTSGSNK